jgi:serine/threonine protein kinase
MPAEGKTKRQIGRYELDAVIGEGGMGSVYKGLDTKTGRTVAVKVVNVPSDERAAEKLRLRFMREVRAVSRIGHPNVVQVHDYGFSDDNTPYLVMEMLVGTDLGKILRSSRSALPTPYVADVILEVCAAVRACHAASIVHRDLKPGNIFLAKTDAGPGWQVKVLDFGIAKAPFGDNLTNLGQIVGTLQYVSPEQVDGTAGPESDQYGIGVILYACLTKRLPFGGLKDVALLKAITRGEFPTPRSCRPELPEALEAIILRAMSVAPSDRFESVYALGQQLWPFASRLGHRSWERFYTAAAAAPAMDTTAEITDRSFPSVEPTEGIGQTPEEDDSPTAIANYESTTVVDVDHAALIGTLPTKVQSGASDDGRLTVPSGQSTSIRSDSRTQNASRSMLTKGRRRTTWVVAVLAALLLMAAALVLR